MVISVNELSAHISQELGEGRHKRSTAQQGRMWTFCSLWSRTGCATVVLGWAGRTETRKCPLRDCWLVLNRRLTRLLAGTQLKRIMRCRSLTPDGRLAHPLSLGQGWSPREKSRLAPASPTRGPERGGKSSPTGTPEPPIGSLVFACSWVVSSIHPGGEGSPASPLWGTGLWLHLHRSCSLSATGQGLPWVATIVTRDIHATLESLGQRSHCLSNCPVGAVLQIDPPFWTRVNVIGAWAAGSKSTGC